jgi:hypothetical protein
MICWQFQPRASAWGSHGRPQQPQADAWGSGCVDVRTSAIFIALALIPAALAQTYADDIPLDHPAIHYANGPFDNPVARLQSQLEKGKQLDFAEGGAGYLPSLLQRLGVKTSFQSHRISPRNPRAIYFADDVAVGFVRGGEVVELAALDREQGIVFYTLDAAKTDRPGFARRGECLKCHQGPATMGVPGIFVGSVYPGPSGAPDRSGAIITDHRTAFADRWGGWYVNALHGEQPDRANSVAPDPEEPQKLEILPALFKTFNAAGYLSPVSDIVALMTFEHQTQMTNLMTRLAWQSRIDPSQLDASIKTLVNYMTFAEEAPLKEPIQGVSTFTETFPKRGPRDRQGRSLRDFDLQTRLFRYPLSYMIYSPSFDALPAPIRAQIYQQISARCSRTVIEILSDTKPDFVGQAGSLRPIGNRPPNP